MGRFPDEFWNALDAAVQQLDQAEAADVDLEQYLPRDPVSWRQRLLTALVKVDLERRWRRQDPRRLECYLDRWPELAENDDLLAELLRAECRIRSEQDDDPEVSELRARFPEVCRRLDVEQLCRGDNGHSASGLADSESLLETIGTGELFRRTAHDFSALPRGHRVGRYRLRSVLGRGGMGTVYLAEDEALDRLVAVKLLHHDIPDGENEVLRAEARAAAQLRHPGIVPVYDIGRDDDGTCFFVMEYIEGESLADRISVGSLTRHEAIGIASQIADVLATERRQGLIHRDIKPANVLIDTDGRARLTDFGLALLGTEREPVAGDVSGTLPYMAPEQVRGDTQAQDARTDLWALGVVLYEMLTGRRPFAGNSWQELSDAILNEEPPPPSSLNHGIPRALDGVVLKCLNKAPEGRPENAAQLVEDLSRLQRPSHVRRAAPMIITFLAALACISLVAAWIRGNRWRPPDVNITEIERHAWVADCDLVFVAHIGAEIDLKRAERLMNSQQVMTKSHLYVSPSDAVDVIARRGSDGWLACEFPLSIQYSKGIPEKADNQSSSGMGPAVVSMKLRLAISPHGVFQYGVLGGDPNEQLLTLILGDGIDNSATFGGDILPHEDVGELHNWFLDCDERQNQFAEWFAQTYHLFHENAVVTDGPQDYGDLYDCPIELRSFFDKEIVVVYGRIAHQQFDYEWYRAEEEWIDRIQNEAWSPIANDPDQDATLTFDVAMRFPDWTPEHAALYVQCQSDNNNGTGFTVEGLTFSQFDRYDEYHGEPGKHTSTLEYRREAGTCTGSETNIAAATLILYGEAPSRITLDATSTWSTVHPWFKYATFEEGDIELAATSSPDPQPDQQIAPRIWRIPSLHDH